MAFNGGTSNTGPPNFPFGAQTSSGFSFGTAGGSSGTNPGSTVNLSSFNLNKTTAATTGASSPFNFSGVVTKTGTTGGLAGFNFGSPQTQPAQPAPVAGFNFASSLPAGGNGSTANGLTLGTTTQSGATGFNMKPSTTSSAASAASGFPVFGTLSTASTAAPTGAFGASSFGTSSLAIPSFTTPALSAGTPASTAAGTCGSLISGLLSSNTTTSAPAATMTTTTTAPTGLNLGGPSFGMPFSASSGGVTPFTSQPPAASSGGAIPFTSQPPAASSGGAIPFTSQPPTGFTLKSTPTTTSAAISLPNFGTSSTATLSTGSTAVSATSSLPNVPGQKQMTFRQLEDTINKWTAELEEQEKYFLDQATQVNAWDRIVMENGEKIIQLNKDVEKVKLDQQKLDHELDFVHAQQRELEALLLPLEKALDSMPPISYQQHADVERENTYVLAESLDAQLKRMGQDLKEIIERLNSTNSPLDPNDPVQQITKILNAHVVSLMWVDRNTGNLQRRFEDISRQMDIEKREQERNFRLAYS